jgi:hypothetical protein
MLHIVLRISTLARPSGGLVMTSSARYAELSRTFTNGHVQISAKVLFIEVLFSLKFQARTYPAPHISQHTLQCRTTGSALQS